MRVSYPQFLNKSMSYENLKTQNVHVQFFAYYYISVETKCCRDDLGLKATRKLASLHFPPQEASGTFQPVYWEPAHWQLACLYSA